ncbi:DNA-binding response regulator [Altericroceibacterium spongiae]|uniref:DNA-binding response regulator n=1 Tax=Altericroceibacterium spongiae TaxID=2320269 RepID=A0A420ER40_9SPHN|nr:response regulator transcription factor [Altericroceibacterium spongiae]RKF23158.1 DNA-binding response regulator [Altericroceibacterium spongiae]
MECVTIYTTDKGGADFANFTHNDVNFSFAELLPEGPGGLIEGPIWIFIDWVLPELSGLEMCRRLRADQRLSDVHITMVLEQDNAEDRRRALKAGADDYMIGPVDRNTLLDRVMALHAQSHLRNPHHVISVGDFVIDLGAEQARWQSHPISLRPNEFRLLRYMLENPDRVLSREELIEGLGKKGEPIDLRTVDVWIKRLRSGLKAVGAGQLLRTVHAKGYVLDAG